MPERVDTGALPLTEPHPAPFFDTGPHPSPLVFDSDTLDALLESARAAEAVDRSAVGPTPVHPIVVPGQLQFVKRWKFALLMVGVWIVAAAIGLGCYYWWFHSIDKTWPVVGVLFYVIVCVVVALLASMAEARPMLSALAMGVMMAPFAAACGAGALYAAYAFGWVVP